MLGRNLGPLAALVAVTLLVCEPAFGICIGCQRGSRRAAVSAHEAGCSAESGERHGLFSGRLFAGRLRERRQERRHEREAGCGAAASEPSCGVASEDVACSEAVDEHLIDPEAFGSSPATGEATPAKPDGDVQDVVWEIEGWSPELPDHPI